jgi:hypothetical protein
MKNSKSDAKVSKLVFCVLICHAASAGPPYPLSPTIEEIVWAPADTIVRRAAGSDNLPVTWADDDAIYITWGDGWGFEPKVPKKLSMGFARVVGGPGDFKGINIRSAAEQLGGGRSGRKGWGLICVDGVLYLWMGHADQRGGQSQMAWSADHAQTWTFADWMFPEFGLIGFINFGKDNNQARDDHVYCYSHDGPLADTPADRFVLMRVPKNRITERDAWEFLERPDQKGQPVWTRDVKRRGAVFCHSDGCLRSAMTYSVALRRYLWWQQIPAPKDRPDRGDTRFGGGFGIYDAPEPWGPWTTAFYTEKWDVGPGEHGDFSAKWMSADGRELYLVFSGEDSFSVRKATIVLRQNEPLSRSDNPGSGASE